MAAKFDRRPKVKRDGGRWPETPEAHLSHPYTAPGEFPNCSANCSASSPEAARRARYASRFVITSSVPRRVTKRKQRLFLVDIAFRLWQPV